MNNQACAELSWISSAKDGIGNSKVLGDLLEFVDRTALVARERPDYVFKALVEVILNQDLLGLADGFSTAWSRANVTVTLRTSDDYIEIRRVM